MAGASFAAYSRRVETEDDGGSRVLWMNGLEVRSP